MSAPSTFDRLVARPVWPAVEPSAPPPRDPRGRFARASKYPDLPGRIDALLEAHEALCRNATDPLEVAAGLEAAGISDKRARASYDAATVFELAEHLYRQVPRCPVAVDRADPWARPMRELMARGLVYALPGLMLVAAMKHFIAAEAMLLLIVSVVAGGANQALSWLYSVQLGRKQDAVAAALLRRALIASVVGGANVALLAMVIGPVSLLGATVAALAVIYLLSATVVLLLERHQLLLRLLIPAVALSLLIMFVPQHLLPREAALVADVVSVVSVVGAFVAAWRLAGAPAGAEGPARPASLTWGHLAGCLPVLAHGMLSMSLLSLIPLTCLRAGSGAPQILGPVMLPAMLSLGAAEVHLYGFRQRAAFLLTSNCLRAFTRAVRLHLLSRVTSYALLLVALTAAVAVVGHRSLEANADATWYLLTYLLLCVGLFVASVLVSTGYVRTVVMIEAAALMLDVALPHLPTVLASPTSTAVLAPLTSTAVLAPLTSTAVHVGSAAVLAIVMLVFGSILLGRVVSYR